MKQHHWAWFFSLGIALIIMGLLAMIFETSATLGSVVALGALITTLLLAALLVFGGIYRSIAALWLRFPHYGWAVFSALASFLLGVLLWAQWPFSATWFLGFAVGLNFFLAGIAWSASAWKLRTISP